jgi:hypothetical protein
MAQDSPIILKEIMTPNETRLLDEQKRDVQMSIHCIKIGVIQDYDAAKQTATVSIAQKQVVRIEPDGTRILEDYPLISKCPVVFPSGGGFTMTFPLAAGDECVLMFNDRQIDAWLVNGPGFAPTTRRVHDISDAIAFVGLRSNPRALEDVSETAVQLRSDDGTNFVEVNQNGVRVHSDTVYEWDVHGYGQKITWTGGSTWRIDNYMTGATVTTVDHAIAPPGPLP